VFGTISLTSTVPSSFALDKPIYCAIVCLTTLATVLLALGRLLPKGDASSNKGQYTAVPLEEVHGTGLPRNHSPHRTDHVAQPPNLRKLRVLFIVLILAICARAELARQVLLNIQCAHGSWEPLVPLALASWDALWRRYRKHSMEIEIDEQTSTIYDIWERRIMDSPYRYFCVVLLATIGSTGALHAIGSPPSTYICAASLPYTWSVPSAQHSGTAMDVLILYCINGLLYSEDDRQSRTPSTRFSVLGWVCLVRKELSSPLLNSTDSRQFSAVLLSTAVCVYYFASDIEDRQKMLMIPNILFWSTTRFDLIVCLTIVSALFCVSVLN